MGTLVANEVKQFFKRICLGARRQFGGHLPRSPFLATSLECGRVMVMRDEERLYGQEAEHKSVGHLGIVVCSYKTTHEASVVGHTSLLNFLSIRCIVSKIL